MPVACTHMVGMMGAIKPRFFSLFRREKATLAFRNGKKVEIASVTASSLDRGVWARPRPLSDQYRIPLADPGGAELQ
jgi:hypothetical protein